MRAFCPRPADEHTDPLAAPAIHQLRRGTTAGAEAAGDNELQTSLWNGNDITLWPGESQTITSTWQSADLNGATPVVSISGWNLPKFDIKAGS